jgi:hypothetical protein
MRGDYPPSQCAGRLDFAVSLDAQILWITLWLTRGATHMNPHVSGLLLDRLNFEHWFSQSNQQLAREVVHVVWIPRAVMLPQPCLWTNGDL